ncbi:Crp/Fnr family transcriptional regulator [Kosmotoga olearia]|uniref:Transcriptional regulator, Crp/Fnr family n=1 Tax=Kosmotoga olearia (strain ATCC BAA-1733 / DSM 21960 / TBF 19.5.1) TaxID=521045 RepID=C5CIJ5_KOSOT|nr:Crp/Fnr family transcriptional regulator [Kosmotoga olearia]ACR79858.1 transcriptional regulator, Crp/Fnr family [Kosmotoga olearia TBF 19.5.1]OAA21214.1 Crp/Fnr family transcriptional regulator [Kosmotoga sp. DU53]
MELRNIRTFDKLNEAEIKYIEKNARVVKVNENKILYSPDEVCEQVSVILKGKLRVSKLFPSGKEQILKYLQEGDTFGETLVFLKVQYPAYIIADTTAKILEIPEKVIFKLFDNKTFLVSYLESVSKKMLNLSNIIEMLSLKSIKQRVAKYLIDLYYSQGSSVINLKKTKKQIAQDIGSVREVVSRAFGDLEKAGMIKLLDKNRVKITDLKKLEEIILKS